MSHPSTSRPGGAAPPYLGFGLGLRTEHYEAVLDTAPAVDWFEIITENFLVPGGKPLYYLERVRDRFPVVMHGVSLSIGGVDPLDREYLDTVKRLADRLEAPWISDHLCWTGVDGRNLHDLLPLPYTEEAVEHVASRVRQVQDHLGRPFLLENVSSYVTWAASVMSEWEFLIAVAERADCRILLDVNNVYVSGRNHGFDPREYLDAMPPDRVWQIHLAGHRHAGRLIVDTHDHPVPDPVWELYRRAVGRLGPVSTMIERDDEIPPLETLVAELDLARAASAAVASPNREERAAVAPADPPARAS